MKCQILFSRKNKKNISKCHQLKFLPSMQSINVVVLVIWFLSSHLSDVKWIEIKLSPKVRFFIVIAVGGSLLNVSLF